MVDEPRFVSHESGINRGCDVLPVGRVEVVKRQIFYQGLSDEVDLAPNVFSTINANQVMLSVVLASKSTQSCPRDV